MLVNVKFSIFCRVICNPLNLELKITTTNAKMCVKKIYNIILFVIYYDWDLTSLSYQLGSKERMAK